MTIDELYAKHSHDSRARRVLGVYRDAITGIERCAARLRAEGDGRWADALESIGHGVLHQARRHVERGRAEQATDAGAEP